MRTIIYSILACLLISGVVYASSVALMPRDGEGAKTEIFAPNGTKDQNLTINHIVVDGRNDLAWSAYVSGGCKFRTMTTATKAGLYRTIPAASRVTNGVNPRTAFINFSGCTAGELQRH